LNPDLGNLLYEVYEPPEPKIALAELRPVVLGFGQQLSFDERTGQRAVTFSVNLLTTRNSRSRAWARSRDIPVS
jgi:hypothetical protein